MTFAKHSYNRPTRRRPLMLVLMLAGALALVASTVPAASAGPAQEEYKLQIPDARGGGGSSTPGDARSELGGGGSSGSSSGTTGTVPGSPGGSSGSGGSWSSPGGSSYFQADPSSDGASGSGGNGAASGGDDVSSDALLAKAREGRGASDLLSASSGALANSPVALAAAGALLLITLAGLLAARRARRAKETF
jgi:hypothetical protein